jgi:hypothetical protein
MKSMGKQSLLPSKVTTASQDDTNPWLCLSWTYYHHAPNPAVAPFEHQGFLSFVKVIGGFQKGSGIVGLCMWANQLPLTHLEPGVKPANWSHNSSATHIPQALSNNVIDETGQLLRCAPCGGDGTRAVEEIVAG